MDLSGWPDIKRPKYPIGRRSFATGLPSRDMDTVVVTGASGGIGGAVTRAFAEEGAQVVASARAEADLDTVEPETGASVTTVRADVRDEYDVERLMETAARVAETGLDVVVPCAAVYHGTPGETPLVDEPYAAFDDTIRTNLRGVFTTVKESVPHLHTDGRVLVPTGAVASDQNPGYGAYAVSKRAVEGLVAGFAGELNHSIGCLDPGVVATELTGGRGREPDEVAGLFTWAARQPADDLNGTTLGLRDWRRQEG